MNWESNGEMWWATYGPVELRVINHNGSYNVVVYGYAGRNLRELGFADLAQAQSRSVEMARGWFDAVPTS